MAAMEGGASSWLLRVVAVLFLAAAAMGNDADPLQDFCVANLSAASTINGLPCKLATSVTSADFKASGFHGPAYPPASTKFGSAFRVAAGNSPPGLNTQGLTLVRLDFAIGGLNPPHSHPRASEVIVVLEGALQVAFIASSNNKVYQEVLQKGDVFVFPRGLLHWQKNVASCPTVAFSALNSQNTGGQFAAQALFSSTPGIPIDVLHQTLGVNTQTIQDLINFQKSTSPASPFSTY